MPNFGYDVEGVCGEQVHAGFRDDNANTPKGKGDTDE